MTIDRPGLNPSGALRRLAVTAMAAAILSGCGGGGGGETVTVLITLRDSLAGDITPLKSLLEAKQVLDQHGVDILGYRCGFADGAKLPIEQRGLTGDSTPRVAYLTLTRSGAELASTLGIFGFEFLTDAFRNTHSDPFDCGPMPPDEGYGGSPYFRSNADGTLYCGPMPPEPDPG